MKNKKILFLVLLASMMTPFVANGQATTLCTFVRLVQGVALQIGVSIAIIGWIIAGILWLISAGSPEKIGTAKKATTAAVIGTILVVIATLIVTIINTTLGGGGNILGC